MQRGFKSFLVLVYFSTMNIFNEIVKCFALSIYKWFESIGEIVVHNLQGLERCYVVGTRC